MKFQEYYNQTIINEGKAKPHKYAMKIEEYIVDAINGKNYRNDVMNRIGQRMIRR